MHSKSRSNSARSLAASTTILGTNEKMICYKSWRKKNSNIEGSSKPESSPWGEDWEHIAKGFSIIVVHTQKKSRALLKSSVSSIKKSIIQSRRIPGNKPMRLWFCLYSG